MGAFVGREKELELLESMYSDEKFRACAIIGRRRIGKTSLIRKFIENRKSVYVQFVMSSAEENLINISIIMSEYLGKEISYDNMFEFFRDLSHLAKSGRYVFVLDEYPFLCDENGTFSSMVQKFIDNDIGDSFLIISGSSVSMLERETSSYDRPLYGRIRKMYLKPMTFGETRMFHPQMGDKDSLKLYLTVGGVPFYHSAAKAETYEEYLDEYVLPENSMFHYEGEDIFSREFSAPADLIAVTCAIGAGRTDIKSIADMTGINRIICSRIIGKLVGMGFVSRVEPMLGAPKKPERYRISDGFLSFHYGVIRRRSFLPDVTYRSISGLIDAHLGIEFEGFCSDYLRRNYAVSKIGKWWGKSVERDDMGNVRRDAKGKALTEVTEIDLVAESYDGSNKVMILAECKFRNHVTDVGTIRAFESKTGMVSEDANKRLMVFSASGFTEDANEYADDMGIELVGPERLLHG